VRPRGAAGGDFGRNGAVAAGRRGDDHFRHPASRATVTVMITVEG